MKKLKMDVERLSVQTFVPAPEAARRGTVVANQEPGQTSFPDPCYSDVSVCNKCWYTANPCECGTSN